MSGTQQLGGRAAPRADQPRNIQPNQLAPWSVWRAELWLGKPSESRAGLEWGPADFQSGNPAVNFLVNFLLFGQDFPITIKLNRLSVTTDVVDISNFGSTISEPIVPGTPITPYTPQRSKAESRCAVATGSGLVDVHGFLAGGRFPGFPPAPPVEPGGDPIPGPDFRAALEVIFNSGSVFGPEHYLQANAGVTKRNAILIPAYQYSAAIKANDNVIVVAPDTEHIVVGLYHSNQTVIPSHGGGAFVLTDG